MSKIRYQEKTEDNTTELKSTNQRKYDNYSNNNNFKKNRYQNKQNKYITKFGFQYDQNKISYNAQIPQMPQRPLQKPDETKHNKKIQELQVKVNQLKKQRKQKKDSYKNGNKGFRDQIEQQKRKINLAKACLVILNYDKTQLENQINDVENKINNHRRKIDFLSRPSQKPKSVKIQEMTYKQLVREQQRVLQLMSTKNLTKSQEVDFSNRLNKIKKRKIEVPKQETNNNGDLQKLQEIESHKNSIQKLRHVRQNLNDKMRDIEMKIQSIQDNIEDFEDKIEDIHDKQRNTDNEALLQQAAQLKQQIYVIWDQIDKLNKQLDAKVHDYEYEQEKIKYIGWAKQIKEKKAEAWQLQKQQRKRQKLREKERQKKGEKTEEKDQKEKQNGKQAPKQNQQNRPTFERKKINRNQKQIDACAFLIQYCKDLGVGNQNQNQKSQVKEVKLQQQLKKGQWAKMKNVQVIKGKKQKGQEQSVQNKNYKKRQNKNPVIQPVDRFSHTYFVAQVFDTVKVLPPTKTQELQKIINELEDKMQYYLAHPDQGIEKSIMPQQKESDRDTKTKLSRKLINTEEFPSLR